MHFKDIRLLKEPDVLSNQVITVSPTKAVRGISDHVLELNPVDAG